MQLALEKSDTVGEARGSRFARKPCSTTTKAMVERAKGRCLEIAKSLLDDSEYMDYATLHARMKSIPANGKSKLCKNGAERQRARYGVSPELDSPAAKVVCVLSAHA